jgi:O-antigen/teichoic acid export membrane protein
VKPDRSHLPDLSRSAFARNAFKMMLGTGLAQALPMAVAPILTRLYSSAEYGAFGVFVGAASVIAVLATGRFEMALVLAEDEAEARRVASLVTRLVLAVTLTSVVVVVFAETTLLSGIDANLRPTSANLILALPVVVAALAASQVGSFWLNRFREYGVISASNVLLQVLQNALTVLAGFLGAGLSGLILGRLVAQVASAWYVVRSARLRCGIALAAEAERALWATARKHYQFPLFNAPNSLVSLVSRDFLIYALSAANMSSSAGLFALARTVIYIPISFLSTSLSQVYFREARDRLGTPELEQLTTRMCGALAVVFAPAFVGLAWFGEDIFALAFGEGWRVAGTFAAVYAPAGYLMLFSSWPERIFEAAGKQWIPFAVQAVSLGAAIAIAVLALSAGTGALGLVAWCSALQVATQLAYLLAAFRIAGFGKGVLVPALVWSVALGLISVIVLFTLGRYLSTRSAMCVSIPILLTYYWGLFIARRRLVR